MSSVMNRFSLKGKLGVVTGAAGLLGTQHVRALLDAGAELALFDVNAEGLKKFTSDRVLPLVTDITQKTSVENSAGMIRDHFKRDPDFLINNAAIDFKVGPGDSAGKIPPSRLEEFSVEQWNAEIAVGLTGAMICSKIFGAAMAKKKSGVILNIASDLGIIAPDQRIYKESGVADHEQKVKPVTYSVIKHGLIGLTRYLATYWAHQGVRCNAFAPGGMWNHHPKEFLEKLTDKIPMGRMADPDEYQAAIVFMCSDASSYMNGAVLSMDGGRTTW
jgi:NAD(P)-dependent dehydrogenase (short-subunit alcohol dehydrogenase family)